VTKLGQSFKNGLIVTFAES